MAPSTSALIRPLSVAILCLAIFSIEAAGREFRIDYENDRFLKDGKPFQIISGSIHYYNVPYRLWEDRLRSMRQCGVNTVQTYIEWRTFEPKNGVFDTTEQNNFVEFFQTAQRQDLLVNLRLGPYIDSERDMGGLPWWLMQANPNMALRSNDVEFVNYVNRFWMKVFSLVKPLLYSNGGPIIMVQLENEYGSYDKCDFSYTTYLLELARNHLGDDVVYYTTDGAGDGFLKCGKSADVYATVDFGTTAAVDSAFAVQRRHERRGPLMNSEFYTGWMDLWGQLHQKISTKAVVRSLDEMLSKNASVNMYMFHGGTHFGFDAGSELYGNTFQICPTSYDYNSPLDEAGDPTEKFFAIKKVISKYAQVPPENPVVKPKLALGQLPLNKTTGLKALIGALKVINDGATPTMNPLTFEALGHPYGLVAYETTVTYQPVSPAVLAVKEIRDRGYVFVDYVYQGMLSREVGIKQIAVRAKQGSTLTILVENQGRVCFGQGLFDMKGILGEVHLGRHKLQNWFHYGIPDQVAGEDGYDGLIPFINDFRRQNRDYSDLRDTEGFGVYQGKVTLTESSTPILLDTYLRFDGWTKGFVFVNNINLGRYWPAQGPQVTLYVPGVYLKYGTNHITVVELESAPSNQTIIFTDTPELDGPIASP